MTGLNRAGFAVAGFIESRRHGEDLNLVIAAGFRLGGRYVSDWFEQPSVIEAVYPEDVSLAELKARSAAAHPDRGGTNTDFTAAREACVQAQRRSRQADES